MGKYFLHYFEQEYLPSLIYSDKIKQRHFNSTKCFIDDLCTINDGGQSGRSICDIYPKELELKVKNQSDHAEFLNLDITIKVGTFTYKLFDKGDFFPISIARMPDIETNIPSKYFSLINQR